MNKAPPNSYFTRQWAFDDYGPAYRFGRETCPRYAGRSFEEMEPELEKTWHDRHEDVRLPWNKAMPAVRRVWYRLQGVQVALSENPPRQR